MKLLLTSSGLTTKKLQEALKGLVTKPVADNRTLIIAVDTKSNFFREALERERRNLIEAGFLQENISIHDLSVGDAPSLDAVDVLEIFGGDNYHYMKRLRETGLMQEIREYIEDERVYVGVSAGAMIMGPDIDENLTSDSNEVGLEDASGFGLVDFYILPHWDWRRERWKSLSHGWRTGKRVVPLTDQQGVLVTEEDMSII
jgi:dipeptidase E